MANPLWPSTLPKPDYGWSEGEVDNMIIRSSNDAGVPKQRLRYTAVATPVTAQILLTRVQLVIFKTFVEVTLKHVLPFDWTDMLTDTGTITYRFTKKPTYTRDGYDSVMVGMALERMP